MNGRRSTTQKRMRVAAQGPKRTPQTGCAVLACPQCGLKLESLALCCPRCRAAIPLGCSGDCRNCGKTSG